MKKATKTAARKFAQLQRFNRILNRHLESCTDLLDVGQWGKKHN